MINRFADSLGSDLIDRLIESPRTGVRESVKSQRELALSENFGH